MIVVVAPYSPAGGAGTAHLGAARKIEAVVSFLSRRGEPLVLVNSAHGLCVRSRTRIRQTKVGAVDVCEVTPPTFFDRRIGKFLNVLQVPAIVDAVSALGKPSLVWLYNGYAFESRFGRVMGTKVGCPVMIELEDWHFSRGRGLNPKPMLDWMCWRALMPRVVYAFAVNASLADRMGGLGERVGLFPGVVADGIAELGATTPPFASDDRPVVVGYFGGLSVEKGADQVAALVRQLPSGFRVVATGSGELEAEFRKLALTHADRFSFHGRVDDGKLLELIGSCDALLNPHTPIETMASGVFPFKVVEGIASGRLMISTPLPSRGLEGALQGVQIVGHDFQQLFSAVIGSRAFYRNSLERVRMGALEANRLFSKEAILDVINQVCSKEMA